MDGVITETKKVMLVLMVYYTNGKQRKLLVQVVAVTILAVFMVWLSMEAGGVLQSPVISTHTL